MQEFAFMVFCLGFFLLVIKIVLSQDDKEYNRKLNEQREFGYQAITPPSKQESKHSK